MIKQDQYIIYVSQAKCAVTLKQTQSMKTGMLEKKIVITTQRCLFFQSLSNQVMEIQYEIMSKKRKKQQNGQKKQPKKRTSINQIPEHSFHINDRQCKIMIDQEPNCHKYLLKIGLRNFIKSITGIVILKNLPKMKFQLLAFPSLKDGFRFCKSVVCSKAWIIYQRHCRENNVRVNRFWSRILTQIINNQKSIVLIDPQLFLEGRENGADLKQIQSFLVLVNQIPFAHSFQHRYSITTNQITQICQQFVQMFQERTHSLYFRHNSMNVAYFNSVFTSKLKLQSIMHLDLSHNKLTDELFVTFQRMTKQCKRLSYFNLSNNMITLHNSTLFINFLKSTQIILSINMSYNSIDDVCIETIQRFVIMPQNPPIQQLNLSFNKFTKKGAWRLFVGNTRYNKYHTYMTFIIYPIPIRPDTFPQSAIQYPKSAELMNYNIHSALVQEFEQQSFMMHALNQFLLRQNQIIRLIRRLPDNVKLPRTKEQVFKSTQFANKIENFMYSHQFIENVYDIAEQIANFQFNLSPVTKQRFIKYLSDKLNEALFIRDHYAVKYILKAFRKLEVDYAGYQPRIDRLITRDQIFNKKIQGIINFEVDQIGINKQLDEMVREGLRLYLTGYGIQSIYYLKYLRDKWIERLIAQKYNPQHFIYERMADKNMNQDDEITEKQMIIPYQIRVEKKINENFYLHPWRANYFTLSQILKMQFDQCLQFLQQSSKKQKFAIYFERIQDRIQFMKNQFALFNYSKFKGSYSDLKINCSRLYSMYRFITEKQFYLQIPFIARKIPITKQKVITMQNQSRFIHEYHINRYPNINNKCRKAGYINYTHKITRYGFELFNQEYNILKIHMDAFFKILQRQVSINSKKIPEQIVRKLVQIIKYLRQSTYPTELKQEFYLRILSWRNGRHINNKQIIQYMPFITMYLRPPLSLQKYIIAGILSCQGLNIGQLPMCIVSDINKTTDITVQDLQKAYVERDWMGSENVLIPLMKNNGKIQISVQLLTKKSYELNIPQSRTIGQIVSNLTSIIKDIQDITHYWLYMGYLENTSHLITLEQSQHIGQLICEKEQMKKYFLFRRRIYCPQWKYLYKKYSQAVINNLFYDFKYEYLLGEFFINVNKMVDLAASMFLIDVAQQPLGKDKTIKDLLTAKLKNLGAIYKGYMPTQAISRFHKSPNDIIVMLRDKINQKIYKKQHQKPIEIKKQILQQFEEYPQFFCTNYIFQDRNKKLVKVSFNWLQIYVNSETQIQAIGLQKIISIIPMTKFLLVNYHKHEGVTGKISLFAEQNKIISAAHDILAYCMIRIKMLSPSLYSAYKYELLNAKHIKVKQPTKDKQILDTVRRIKKSLMSATPTILDLQPDVIPYFGPNKYVKAQVSRKLYANASLQKLDFVDDLPQQDDDQGQRQIIKRRRNFNDDSQDLSTHNVFKTIFPKLKKPNNDNSMMNEQDQIPMSMLRSASQPLQLSAYDDINSSYAMEPESMKKKQPMNQSINQPVRQAYQPEQDDFPPELMTIKNNKNVNSSPPEQQFQPITTQKARTRLPPKRNR